MPFHSARLGAAEESDERGLARSSARSDTIATHPSFELQTEEGPSRCLKYS